MDKKGKEAYFAEDPDQTEYTLFTAVPAKAFNPAWTLKTDDWGYFYRAFQRGTLNSDSTWKDYDALLAIAITAGITGFIWFITAIIDIRKFCSTRWDMACYVYLKSEINL